MNTEQSIIKKTDTRVAVIISLLTCFAEIIYTHLFKSIIGWTVSDTLVLLPVYLLNMCVLFLFSQYINNYKQEKIKIAIYIILITLGVQILVSILILILPRQFYYLMGITSLFFNLLAILRMVLYVVVGINLLEFKNDKVGGLKILGIAFILNAVGLICNIIETYYIFYKFSVDLTEPDADIIIISLQTYSDLSKLFLAVCMLLLFIKVYIHRKKV